MREYTLREFVATKLNLLPTSIQDAFSSVLFGRLFVVATRLGVFDALHNQSRTVREVAAALKLPEKSLHLALSPLAAAGYLSVSDHRYSLTPQASKWLVRSSPYYIGNFLAYIELLHHRWMNLEETLRRGAPAASYVDSFTPAEWKIYTLGMMDLARLIIPRVIPKIKLPSNATSLLDICGSHGLYSTALLQKHPRLSSTIIDLPQVLESTPELIVSTPAKNRITLVAADITKSDFSLPTCDAALLFNAIHGFSDDINGRLIRLIADNLTRGGSVYILDQLSDVSRSGVDRMLPLMVGLNLLNEIGGNVYGLNDVKRWCREAGFVYVRSHRIGLPGVRLVEAKLV